MTSPAVRISTVRLVEAAIIGGVTMAGVAVVMNYVQDEQLMNCRANVDEIKQSIVQLRADLHARLWLNDAGDK